MPTCSVYQAPEIYTEITLGGREDKLQKHVSYERNNQDLCVPRLFVHMAQNRLREISSIRSFLPHVGHHAPSSEHTQMSQCHMSATMNHLD